MLKSPVFCISISVRPSSSFNFFISALGPNPVFLVKDISGPDHLKTFEIQVKIGPQTYASGLGTNKKTAEQTAARLALEELGAAF